MEAPARFAPRPPPPPTTMGIGLRPHSPNPYYRANLLRELAVFGPRSLTFNRNIMQQ